MALLLKDYCEDDYDVTNAWEAGAFDLLLCSNIFLVSRALVNVYYIYRVNTKTSDERKKPFWVNLLCLITGISKAYQPLCMTTFSSNFISN